MSTLVAICDAHLMEIGKAVCGSSSRSIIQEVISHMKPSTGPFGPHVFGSSGNAPDAKRICHHMASMIGLPLFA